MREFRVWRLTIRHFTGGPSVGPAYELNWTGPGPLVFGWVTRDVTMLSIGRWWFQRRGWKLTAGIGEKL